MLSAVWWRWPAPTDMLDDDETDHPRAGRRVANTVSSNQKLHFLTTGDFTAEEQSPRGFTIRNASLRWVRF